jgi:hypothetical protein
LPRPKKQGIESILDEISIRPRAWSGWGWTENNYGKADPATIVHGSQIQEGDYILFSVDEEGRRIDRFAPGEDSRVVKTRDGRLGFKLPFDRNAYPHDFSLYYEVKLPRPEPEVNEFGQVSP